MYRAYLPVRHLMCVTEERSRERASKILGLARGRDYFRLSHQTRYFALPFMSRTEPSENMSAPLSEIVQVYFHSLFRY